MFVLHRKITQPSCGPSHSSKLTTSLFKHIVKHTHKQTNTHTNKSPKMDILRYIGWNFVRNFKAVQINFFVFSWYKWILNTILHQNQHFCNTKPIDSECTKVKHHRYKINRLYRRKNIKKGHSEISFWPNIYAKNGKTREFNRVTMKISRQVKHQAKYSRNPL